MTRSRAVSRRAGDLIGIVGSGGGREKRQGTPQGQGREGVGAAGWNGVSRGAWSDFRDVSDPAAERMGDGQRKGVPLRTGGVWGVLGPRARQSPSAQRGAGEG